MAAGQKDLVLNFHLVEYKNLAILLIQCKPLLQQRGLSYVILHSRCLQQQIYCRCIVPAEDDAGPIIFPRVCLAYIRKISFLVCYLERVLVLFFEVPYVSSLSHCHSTYVPAGILSAGSSCTSRVQKYRAYRLENDISGGKRHSIDCFNKCSRT